MSWLNVETATRIRDELRAIAPSAKIRCEIHPDDEQRARVSLVLRDAQHGNTVYREADETTDAAQFLREARAELERRARKTRRRIAAEEGDV